MGLFKRRSNDEKMPGKSDIDSAKTKGSWKDRRSKIKRGFLDYLKETWPDHLFLTGTVLLTLAIYKAPRLSPRTFRVDYSNGEPIPTYGLDQQYRPYILNSTVCTVISLGAPTLVILLMQIKIKSNRDFNNALFGLQFGLATSGLMHVIIASVVGGLRPNFFDVCKLEARKDHGQGWETDVLDRKACTGKSDMVKYAFSSFPSGHSTAAFAGMVFLSLYLNAKFKVLSNYRPPYWNLHLTCAPILAAIIVSGMVIIDHSHHWYDVVAGASLGTLMAFTAYRMVYASVFDFRFNHIPLARYVPFQYGTHTDSAKYEGLGKAMWTRDAGWGDKSTNPWDGAPFDKAGSTSSGSDAGRALERSQQVPVGDVGQMA